MRSMGRETEAAGKKSAQAWRDVRTVLVSIGAIAAAGRTIRFMRDLSRESIQVASDVEEMRSAFKFVFEDLEGQATRFAENFARTTNRSVFDIQRALTDFQLFFEPIGFAADEALRLSQSMVKLGVDLGSLFNVSPQEALERLRQGLAGSPEATRRIGIVVNEQILRQTALSKGIVETNRQLTQQERALAFVAASYDRASKAIGDAQRTRGSFANRMIGLRAEVTEAKVEIGEGLIQAIDAAAEAMGGWEVVTDRITGALKAMGAAAEGVIEVTGNAFAAGGNAATMRGGGRLFSLPQSNAAGGAASTGTIFDLSQEELLARMGVASGPLANTHDFIAKASASEMFDFYKGLSARVREVTPEMEALAKKQLEVMDAAASLGLADPRSSAIAGVPPSSGMRGDAPLTSHAKAANKALAEFFNTMERGPTQLGLFASDSFGFAFENAFADWATDITSASDAWDNFARSLFRDFAQLGGRFLSNQILGGIFGLPTAALFANGGTGSFGDAIPVQGYAAAGPIMRGPHVAVMGEGQHDEAVVPLPNGRSIPVDMRGGGSGGGNVFIISSPLDANSLVAAAQQDPEAFAAVVMSEVSTNPQLRALISDTPTRYNG